MSKIAQWMRPRLPSYSPVFKSQAHYLCFLPNFSQILYYSFLSLCGKKKPGLARIKIFHWTWAFFGSVDSAVYSDTRGPGFESATVTEQLFTD